MTVAAGLKINDEDNYLVAVCAVAMFKEVDTEEFLKIYTQKDNPFIAVNAEGKNWFWINSNILFNGDRVIFIQDYKIKCIEDTILKSRTKV